MAQRATVILVIVVLAAGCGTVGQLSRMRRDAAAENYRAITAEEVTCTQGERGCNQVHLIKGDACFRLAAGGEPGRWDCAIEQLALGIDTTEGTTTEMGSTQPYYENLLEALRQRRDLSRSRAEAAPFTAQLETRAQAFHQAFPTAPAGYYYLASAQLTRALDPNTAPDAACRTLNDAQSLLARAPAERGRYAASLQRVEADIRGAKSTVRGCV
ncbi:MAG: hypothetical protein M3361_11815 [Candidatus Tectomicrobia bacterium]|nr:hypothetical protein [Candidatus Tectomicrobia bacterium]